MKIAWLSLNLPPINLWSYPKHNHRKDSMNIELLNNSCKPVRSSEHAAGWDVKASWIKKIYARSPVDITLDYIQWEIGLGFKSAIANGWCAVLMPRSGLGSKGFKLSNTIGLIDPDYRGEWVIKAVSPTDMYINQGDRIGQFILIPTYNPEQVEFVNALPSTARGDKGFGSTGV
jgi:dUTP pyrophosphatase